MTENCGAILLACGHSSRMGRDKASLEINNQTGSKIKEIKEYTSY